MNFRNLGISSEAEETRTANTAQAPCSATPRLEPSLDVILQPRPISWGFFVACILLDFSKSIFSTNSQNDLSTGNLHKLNNLTIYPPNLTLFLIFNS